MPESISFSLDTDALDALVDEYGAAVHEAARPAAQAGAQVLYEEVKRNVAALGKKSGNLERSIYQVFSNRDSAGGNPTYHISWNVKVAPHGHLLEYGHIQRYATYVGNDGKWHTAVRPEMRGKKAPGRRASQAEKDAYYVLREGGPIQWLSKSFVRKAAAAFPKALEAAEQELMRRLGKV